MTVATDKKRGFRLLTWIAIVCAAGLLVVTVKIAGVFFLSNEAREMQIALADSMDQPSHAQVQLSVGPGLISIGRMAAMCIDEIPAEAHHALKAVKNASVGVYQLDRSPSRQERVDMVKAADRRLADRGWTRMVIVANDSETVMIYTPENWNDEDEIQVCIAVCDGRDLVVVSAEAKTAPLMELVKPHLPVGRAI